VSKGELRSLYIAKDDEYEFGSSLSGQREESWLPNVLSVFLPHDAATYFFDGRNETRLPTDALIDLSSDNHRLQQLIISPPESRSHDRQAGKDSEDLVFAVSHIQEFFRHRAFTLKNIGEQPFTFPPGHPVSRTFYKQHPLASYRLEKRNYYIPSSMYDSTLFSEREAELMGIFVDLGATKIRIFTSSACSSSSTIASTGKIGMGAFEAAAKFKALSESEKESFDNRELVLDGQVWHQGNALDRTKYGWLSFEPEWEAIVKAREVGHCRTAEIELFKRSTFHTESESSVKLRKHFAKAEAATSQAKSGTEVDHKLIQVEFGPALPPKKKSWLAKLTD
jgi:hypothetical protein